jgi:type II secretory pathway pseudopilin PulG
MKDALIRSQRTAHGTSLVEMLVTTVIMSIIALSFMGMLLVNFHTNAKVDNVQDTANAMRIIKERIGRDVRMGRSLGDVYGDLVQDPTSLIWYLQGSDSFPSANDPVYGGTPPTTPTGWPAPPYRLGNQCLIVQMPVLDDHNDTVSLHQRNAGAKGWPTMITTAEGNPKPSNNVENVETHVYRVVPDPANANEWILQYCSFGGMTKNGYQQSAHTFGPETILTGIIGPLDKNGQPKVFQFVKKTANTSTAISDVAANAESYPSDTILPDGSHAAEYTGVVVNLCVRRHQTTTTTRRDISLTPIGFKLEVFLRNNALATSTNNTIP